MSWTGLLALAAHTTLGRVDVSHIVFNCDSIEVANLLALTATDTSYGTSLLGNSALVLVDTLNINAATLRSLFA